jgi:hypothetical protein
MILIDRLRTLLIMAMLICPAGFAANAMADAGTAPGSPFYFLDTWWDGMRVRMADSFEDKERLAIEIAEERAAEMLEMTGKGDEKGFLRAFEQHQRQLQKIDELNNESERQMIQLQQRFQSHIMNLETVREQVPEQAKEGIGNAIENANMTFTRSQERIRQENRQDNDEIRQMVESGAVKAKGRLR